MLVLSSMIKTDTIITTNVTSQHSFPIPMTKKEQYYYNKIFEYYRCCDPNKIEIVSKIIGSEYNISLRVIDWFVTKYANFHKIKYKLDDGQYFNVHISYEAQLKTLKKQYFDPFRRTDRFEFNFSLINQTISTTLGQLNFFMWAIENKIIDYIITNLKTIAKAMNDDVKKQKTSKSQNTSITESTKNIDGGTTISRFNISESANSTIVSFD